MVKIIKWTVIGLLGLALVIFSIVNRAPVDFSLFPLPYEIRIPLFILLYVTLFVGVALGEVLGLVHSRKLHVKIKQSEQRIKALESEVLVQNMENGSPDNNIKKIGLS